MVHAIEFIESLLPRAKAENSALGRYGLLPSGFADGGFDGSREELTNTIWTLAAAIDFSPPASLAHNH
jgi:hypothetical protein